jgi:hypothetical protein
MSGDSFAGRRLVEAAEAVAAELKPITAPTASFTFDVPPSRSAHAARAFR